MKSAFGVEHGADGFPPLWYEVSKGYLKAVNGIASTAVRQTAKAVKLGPEGRAAQMREMGALHRAKGGKLHEAVNRPLMPGASRKAWDRGYGSA